MFEIVTLEEGGHERTSERGYMGDGGDAVRPAGIQHFELKRHDIAARSSTAVEGWPGLRVFRTLDDAAVKL